jgi:uncharacterized glyoxalase superfamily protein PhnB
MNTLFPLILTDRPDHAAGFCRTLFDFEVVADLGWYVQLQHPQNGAVQIAFISDRHDSVPAPFRQVPQGVLVTIEIDDAAAYRVRAGEAGHPIHVDLTDEVWGQRHFITEDPTGLLVDVVQQIEPNMQG